MADERPDLRDASDVDQGTSGGAASTTDSGIAGTLRSARKALAKSKAKRGAKKLKRKRKLRSLTSPLREAKKEASGLISDVKGDTSDLQGDDANLSGADLARRVTAQQSRQRGVNTDRSAVGEGEPLTVVQDDSGRWLVRSESGTLSSHETKKAAVDAATVRADGSGKFDVVQTVTKSGGSVDVSVTSFRDDDVAEQAGDDGGTSILGFGGGGSRGESGQGDPFFSAPDANMGQQEAADMLGGFEAVDTDGDGRADEFVEVEAVEPDPPVGDVEDDIRPVAGIEEELGLDEPLENEDGGLF